MKRKNLLAILAIVSIVAIMPASGLYGQDTQKKIGGELTPDIAWHIANDTLYISGQGVVPTTMFGAKSAWFDYRSQFHTVVIMAGITGLGKNVFTGYKDITSLIVAGSVKELGVNSFNSCKKLSVVEAKGAIPPDINATTFYGVKLKTAKLIVPAGTKSIYEADALWNKFSMMEESAQPAEVQPVPNETLSEPCNIHLTRTSNFIGGGVSLRVFLNGVEQSKLGNASTIDMQTDKANNMLYIQQGKDRAVAIRRFVATAGGDIRIEFSFFNGYMKILEGEEGKGKEKE